MGGGRGGGGGGGEDEAAAATWTCRLVVIGSIGIGRLALRLWRSEQFAGARDVVGAGGVGQQAVVADAGGGLRQGGEEESAGESVFGGGCLLCLVSGLAFGRLSL